MEPAPACDPATVPIALDTLKCPLTYELPLDPVIAEDGFVYDRESIARWILTSLRADTFLRSPLTNMPMGRGLIKGRFVENMLSEVAHGDSTQELLIQYRAARAARPMEMKYTYDPMTLFIDGETHVAANRNPEDSFPVTMSTFRKCYDEWLSIWGIAGYAKWDVSVYARAFGMSGLFFLLRRERSYEERARNSDDVQMHEYTDVIYGLDLIHWPIARAADRSH